MPVIGAKVSAELKVSFDSIAVSRDTTSSSLAALLIKEFINRELRQPGCVDLKPRPSAVPSYGTGQGTKTEQVFVRMEPQYFSELGRLAAQRLWPRGTYLGNLFRAHLDQRPVLCDLEINAVRQVARQLAHMGRNMNQIASKLNTSTEHSYLAMSIDFELIKMLIELETSTVKNLLKANVRGWGIGNAET
ncbi:hypothetical protein [Massilia sp. DD77]|uniref:hypothetical protein n=1 Tax=Massilia sp. DD77 TaxID=3109349 RepID=UPI002FFF9F5D